MFYPCPMQLENIKTPALVLDVARVRRNAARMSERARALGVRLRPHVKTHKCVEVARIQTGIPAHAPNVEQERRRLQVVKLHHPKASHTPAEEANAECGMMN